MNPAPRQCAGPFLIHCTSVFGKKRKRGFFLTPKGEVAPQGISHGGVLEVKEDVTPALNEFGGLPRVLSNMEQHWNRYV